MTGFTESNRQIVCVDSGFSSNLVSESYLDSLKLERWKPKQLEELVVKSVFGDCMVSNKSIRLKVKIAGEVTFVDFGVIRNLPCRCVVGIPYMKLTQ